MSIRKLFESEMEKAEIQLAVRDVADSLQKMASDISRTTVDEVPAVVERIKASFGVAEGNKIGEQITSQLRELVERILETKSNIDDISFVISGDASEADLAADMARDDDEDIAQDMNDDLALGGDEEIETDVELDLEDVPIEPDLGRKVKESRHNKAQIIKEATVAISEAKTLVKTLEAKKASGKKLNIAESGQLKFAKTVLAKGAKPVIKEAAMSATEAKKVVKELEAKKASGKKLNPSENGKLNIAKGVLKGGKKTEEVKESAVLYPVSMKRLMEQCSPAQKKLVESMYNAGPTQRKKVMELAKKTKRKS